MYERGFTAVVPVLADVKNRAKMPQLFERYRPTVVFHAAAYKHVPLMEANPLESVRNNVVSTQVVAEVAAEFGVRTLRARLDRQGGQPEERARARRSSLCEWIVERGRPARGTNGTRFLAVRFGNVLGSSGSVIPLFRRQIARGGPGDRHASGDDALLHDDPGGRPADRPGGRDRRDAATSSSSTWASR